MENIQQKNTGMQRRRKRIALGRLAISAHSSSMLREKEARFGEGNFPEFLYWRGFPAFSGSRREVRGKPQRSDLLAARVATSPANSAVRLGETPYQFQENSFSGVLKLHYWYARIRPTRDKRPFLEETTHEDL
ncbi:hypothetical protein K2O51_09775 [Cupriavidus pinatubonensis]|uniref:hypothetical protein n=1 Tax=Cupriavidus pinatubonensis TaxID=248026 RepID=UPI001C733F0F|nr:hypothetical protein [Cupriavidus pinatubonensis]QYY28177.1 hypothetical protein K2O51_09775 [Cupriavidus pinatubonensis]